jgi:ATP synthase protein I
MADPQGPPHDETLRRFDERLETLAASQARKPQGLGMESGASAGYRLIGELIGGVLTGLGLGWAVDRFAGTAPVGLIAGVLIGTGVAIFMAVRTAGRMSGAQAAQAGNPPAAPKSQDRNTGGL